MSQQLIETYQSQVEKTIHFGGSKKETAIRNHFFNPLNEYAHQKGLELVVGLSIKTKAGKTITPDGTRKDMLQLDWAIGKVRTKPTIWTKKSERKTCLELPLFG